MNLQPCNVCGGTDVNLVDGYYYCVECGTQDANVRETVIEDRALADGTFTIKRHTRVTIAAEEIQELSGEWHKWHAFNFILSGLADELIAAGAKPTFKRKLLWLWTKYIKMFQNKDELGLTKDGEEEEVIEEEDEVSTETSEDEYDELNLNARSRRTRRQKKRKKRTGYRILKMTTDLSVVKKGLLLSLIHAALNLDGSEIQLHDLLRLIKEGHVDIRNCSKYLPKEIKKHLIPQWGSFPMSKFGLKSMKICAMSVFKCLNVLPVLPDLRLIVDRFTKELCLPKDFKNLVFSLMDLIPCDVFLEIDRSIFRSLLRIPAYEYTIMAYILVAFKMCFGLDDNYEVKLSDAVDKINDENCHLKSYKLGDYIEPTDRLFSFREWCGFIQLRKIILCKYSLYMAQQYALDIDDYVYMEHCKGRQKNREPLLSDEITMNLLNKIPQINSVEVIPKSEFKPTLTPMTTYTDLVLQYFKDPDLRLTFSEDFTQYSLKYACENLHLCTEDDLRNIISGVDDTKKVINKRIYGRLEESTYDAKMVYVRNCDNKNWLKTNQPSLEHVKQVKKSNSDRESDHGYNSNADNSPDEDIRSKDEENSNIMSVDNSQENVERETENSPEVELSSKDEESISSREHEQEKIEEKKRREKSPEIEISSKEESSNNDSVENVKEEAEIEKKLEIIEEEDVDKNIFDDLFENLVFVEQQDHILNEDDIKSEKPDTEEINVDHESVNDFANDPYPHDEDFKDDTELFFNPDTFNRERTIKELILATCIKYKIRIPAEYDTREPKKRKSNFIKDAAGESGTKKRRIEDGGEKRKFPKRGAEKEQVNRLVVDYYSSLQQDVMFQISEHVKNVVGNVSRAQDDETVQNEANDPEETDENRVNIGIDFEDDGNTAAEDRNVDDSEILAVDNTNLEQSSLQVVGNDEGGDEPTQAKDDPRFNENEYDINQLYVKVDGDEDSVSDDLFGISEDAELLAILDKKIEESNKGEIPPPAPEEKKRVYDSDDDDMPLSVLKEEITAARQLQARHDDMPKLVVKQENITEFKYWTRFYASTKMRKLPELHEPFNLELQENLPVSFDFVIKECAGIIDCSPYHLYKSMVLLEQRILCQNM